MIKTVEGIKTYFARDDDSAWGYLSINTTGLFMAHTDYGSFGYHWPVSEGFDFVRYLSNLTDTNYLLGKISRQTQMDERKTRKVFAKEIILWRREKWLTKERARELYKGIKDAPTGPELLDWAMREQELAEASCYEWAVYDYPADARMFAERLFPLLREQLKAETAPQEATA